MSFTDDEVKRENFLFFLRADGGYFALRARLQPLASTSLPLEGLALCAGFICGEWVGPILPGVFVCAERRLNPRWRRETDEERGVADGLVSSVMARERAGTTDVLCSRPQGLIVRQSVNNKLAASPQHPGAPSKRRK